MSSLDQQPSKPSLKIHICELKPGLTHWSASISLEAQEVGLENAMLAVFFQGQRLATAQLDDWGYAMINIDQIPPPQSLIENVQFEIKAQNPAYRWSSLPFQPPLVYQSLAQFLEVHKTWSSSLPLRGAKLQNLHLSNVDLRNVDLRGADLSGTKLWQANLNGTVLKEANLQDVDFGEADLRGADLEAAQIQGANFNKAQVNGADFRNTKGMSLELLIKISAIARIDERQERTMQMLRDKAKEHKDKLEQEKQSESKVDPKTNTHINPQSSKSQAQSQVQSPEDIEKSNQLHRELKRAQEFQKYNQQRKIKDLVSFQMNFIPSGHFQMGTKEGDLSFGPPHLVKITRPFLLSQAPVTQSLYELVMGRNPSKFKGAEQPVDSVNWFDAIDFCNRLSKIEGLRAVYEVDENRAGEVKIKKDADGYRLPTEAEWEYTARAGVDFQYAGSDIVGDVAWFLDNANGHTHAVCQKKANAWGLHDMSGNVWEWCFDAFDGNAYGQRPMEGIDDPVVNGNDVPRLLRGGSWSYEIEGLTVFFRFRLAPHFRTSRVGFRIARSPRMKS
jgi:sulfatase modifying factor 1